MIIFAFLTVAVALITYNVLMVDPPKIFDIYHQPGKWYYVKYAVMYTIISLQRLSNKFSKKNIFDGKKLDTLKQLSSHEKAFDAVFFQAVSQDGFYICGGTERRHQSKVNGLMYIGIPEMGFLLSEKLPNTVLEADPASVLYMKEYAAEGIRFTPVEPMKKWKVEYKGKMRSQQNPNKLLNVDLEADWTSRLPVFLFERDVPVSMLANALAMNPWSGKFFKLLKEAHQTHYEQMGHLNGTLRVEDKVYNLKMDAFRDHSFGNKRDWTIMYRYIFHMFYLSDGTKASFGVVCQPCTSTHIDMGFVVLPDKTIHGIDGTDLKLYENGEDGVLPSDLEFTFSADGVKYNVKVRYDNDFVHYVGNNTEAKMNERFLSCEINGVKGKGISEWHYNNTKKFS